MESVSHLRGHLPPRANEFLAQDRCDAQESWGAHRLPRAGIGSFAPNATPSALRPPTSCLHPSGCAEAGHKRKYADCAGRSKPPGDSSTPPVPGGNIWRRRASHAEAIISRKNKRSTRTSPLNKETEEVAATGIRGALSGDRQTSCCAEASATGGHQMHVVPARVHRSPVADNWWADKCNCCADA